MRVFLYSELQRQIEKSGVGRAILHQRKALEANGVCCAERWQDADVVHINTVFPHSFFLAKKAKRHGSLWFITPIPPKRTFAIPM